MVRYVYPSLLLAVLLTASLGCRVGPAQYMARATIQTRPSNLEDLGNVAIVPAELKLLQTMADSVVTGATHQVSMEHVVNTQLVRVYVTTADPEQAATLCNDIAERFVAAAGEGDIERHLIEMATPPQKPVR